jgi:hypothetical protein
VFWSPSARQEVKAFVEKSPDSEVKKALAKVLRAIEEQLLREPQALGEVYRTRGAIEQYLAAKDFVCIDFAVDKDRKFVFVRKCKLSGPYAGPGSH